jgi:hypothetical protein
MLRAKAEELVLIREDMRVCGIEDRDNAMELLPTTLRDHIANPYISWIRLKTRAPCGDI